MQAALDLGIGAVMPLLMGHVLLDEEARAADNQSVGSVQRMIAAA